MKLFRYFNLAGSSKDRKDAYVYRTLADNELYLSKISEFNDPFEALCRDITLSVGDDQKCRDYLDILLNFGNKGLTNLSKTEDTKAQKLEEVLANTDRIRETLSFNGIRFIRAIQKRFLLPKQSMKEIAEYLLRISCFANAELSNKDDILLWSHYADKHKGIRIGFNFDEKCSFPYVLKPVRYANKRVELDFIKVYIEQRKNGVSSDWWKDGFYQLLTTKSKVWAYEREHRLLTSPPSAQPTQPNLSLHIREESDGRSFLKFRPENIWTVDFGCNFSQQDLKSDIIAVMRAKFGKIPIRQAKMNERKYALDYDNI